MDRRYRFWNFYSYVVCYVWQRKPIQIIAVVHGARDLGAFFGSRLALAVADPTAGWRPLGAGASACPVACSTAWASTILWIPAPAARRTRRAVRAMRTTGTARLRCCPISAGRGT
ncbi:hypothetical protein SBA4_1550002 [Candidatus Sulfopaludibacter sp. SbA4]|nr:hypothetical protein SBA4_1550002 [Candidatus Sulfopaludibacter sp. SbA4]